MDERQRTQLKRIIDFELEVAARDFPETRERIFAKRGLQGNLSFSSLMPEATAEIRRIVSGLMERLLEKCGQVSRDTEAFSLIEAAISNYFVELELSLPRLVSIVGGSKNEGIKQAVSRAVKQVETDQLALLAIAKFSYCGPNDQGSPVEPPALGTPSVNAKVRNPGGRPLAAHWDAMWSDIAAQIYVGDLKPTGQAVIQQAMNAWFDDKEIDVGETAIKERARSLWQAIEAAQ